MINWSAREWNRRWIFNIQANDACGEYNLWQKIAHKRGKKVNAHTTHVLIRVMSSAASACGQSFCNCCALIIAGSRNYSTKAARAISVSAFFASKKIIYMLYDFLHCCLLLYMWGNFVLFYVPAHMHIVTFLNSIKIWRGVFEFKNSSAARLRRASQPSSLITAMARITKGNLVFNLL